MTETFTAYDHVVRLLAGILYVEPAALDVNAEFGALGLDSILAVEFCTLLKDELGINVPAATVYEHRTPHEFARYLSTRLAS